MEELTLGLKQNDKNLRRWFVSYVLPGFSFARSSRKDCLENDGCALVFVAPKHTPEETFENVRRLPVGKLFFGDRYCVTFMNNAAYVHSREVTQLSVNPNEYSRRFLEALIPTHFGIVNKERSFFWSIKKLLRHCTRIEKFSNCDACPHAKNGKALGSCVETIAQNWLADKGYSETVLDQGNNYRHGVLKDPETLGKMLKRIFKSGNPEFVSPGVLGPPFRNSPLYMNEISAANLVYAEELVLERSRSAKRGHKTRKALKICKKCYLFDYCDYCSKPYNGWPHLCQQNTKKNSYAPGPFTESEIIKAALRNIAAKNPLTREEIALIAYHGGVHTGVFGFDLMLRGMDANLQNVTFIHERSGNVRTYAFNDAVEILRARFYEQGGYSGARWQPEAVPPMSDKDLVIYAQLNEIGEIPVGMGYYQPITYISWFPNSSLFRVGIRNHFYHEISDLPMAGSLGRRLYGAISIAPRHHIRAVREEEGLETSPGILP